MVRVLAHVSKLINQELLLQVEYLAAENQVHRAHLPERLRLTIDERSRLAEIGKRLGRKGLEKVDSVARPETILGWSESWLPRSSTAPSTVRILAPGHYLRVSKPHCSVRTGKLKLGIRSHLRCAGEPGT